MNASSDAQPAIESERKQAKARSDANTPNSAGNVWRGTPELVRLRPLLSGSSTSTS